MTALRFGTDFLCHYCTKGKNKNGLDCLHCTGTGLEPSPHAAYRRSDPETSREAAASISTERLRASQQLVLHTLERFGPMNDEALVRRMDYYRMSPSGARTRRAELVARGLVYDTGKRETLASGRKAVVWGAR